MDYAAAMIPHPIPCLVLVLGLFAGPALAAPMAHHVPPDATAATLIAQAHDAQGRGEIELALRLAQSAIVANPAWPQSYIALGDIYAGAGQKDFARNFYDKALAIDPAEPAALKAIAALDDKTPRVLATP
jgi:Flp pilus assembly protein TadD